jgi:glyoxylase-like metal-dependent hydrolase (beta-lactamase superfamily II)
MEILSDVHLIDDVTANTYLALGKQTTLIDTGTSGKQENIINYLQNELKGKPEDIKTIVLTHHHMDHTGSLYELKKLTNADIAAYKEDVDIISGEKSSSDPIYMRFVSRLMTLFTSYKFVKPDIGLEENDMVDDYRVIHTPGHTPGSIALYNSDNGVIFVGDTLTYDGKKVGGPPSFFINDHDALKKSIKKISDLDPMIMLSGHGKPLTENTSEMIRDFYNTL